MVRATPHRLTKSRTFSDDQSPSGGAAAYAISRFRFRSSAEGYDRFLTVLVSSLNKDAAVEATQFGWIDE